MAIVKRDRGWPEVFERVFDRPERWFGGWPEQLTSAFDENWMRVEQFRDGAEEVIRAELPGIDPDNDVEITLEHDTVRIHAHRRQEEKVEEKHRYRSEFRYGSFTRSIPLPAGASEEDVKATYTDGVLEVRVPVSEEKASARRIPIDRG